MSNSIGHNLIHHNLLALVVLEHQSKINSSCISGYNLFQVQANSQIRKSHITSKFWGKCLNLRKTKLPMGTNRVLSIFPQSVLATNPTSKLILTISFIVATYRKFNLDGNTKLQVVVSAPTSGSVSEIDMQVTNTSGTLVLHWGGIQNGKEIMYFSNCKTAGMEKANKDKASSESYIFWGFHNKLCCYGFPLLSETYTNIGVQFKTLNHNGKRNSISQFALLLLSWKEVAQVEYQNLFHRVSLQLSKSSKNVGENGCLDRKKHLSSATDLFSKNSEDKMVSTAERVKSFQTDEDPSLVELLF
ncbi:hypothetical protein LOK49_Contig24G00002 [Camellia lanceoleosa]|nr:hypothetical protein LOK49_Contig24G00002 [Camellia lanceoleosa]